MVCQREAQSAKYGDVRERDNGRWRATSFEFELLSLAGVPSSQLQIRRKEERGRDNLLAPACSDFYNNIVSA